ncbi:MarR family transcriptional regulator [Streptomyces armeniacus]|uniref:MarR family transcriptional regulator n=1 Tax=Streptomyces armeniacus TaxID=83291 RepID=A0A345XJZ8_9ACTN|nr:MarR family transcriptional regulator [Streptomyces armeniacus]AXK31964.1 MarR family transcriptional regulator [Streptomyces armeniacus]
MPPHPNPRPPAPSPAPARASAPRAEEPAGGESAGDLADQLLWLTRRLHHAHKRNLAPVGITPAQSRLLRTVARSDGPPRMADVAERLGVVPRAVTTLVDALEERRLVRRVPDPASRRVVRLEVTEEGTAVLKELRSARRSAAEAILAPLSQEQRTELSGLLALLGAERGQR